MAFLDPTQKEILEEQKQYLKGKSFKYKAQYLIEYYGVPALLILGGIAIVVSLLVTTLMHKANGIQVLFVNSMSKPDEKAFETYAGIDTSKYVATFDDGYIIQTTVEDNNSYINIQKMIAVITAKDGDGIVGDYETLSSYNNSEFFGDLRNFFTDEELAAMGDKVIWHEFTDEEGKLTGESAPILIDVSDSPVLKDSGCYNDEIQVVYGIIINSQRVDNAKAFYYFLYEQNNALTY